MQAQEHQNRTMRDRIETALQDVRPLLARHLGNVEFVRYEEGIVYLRLLGTCAGCPLSELTLKAGIESMLKERIPTIKQVQAVTQ